MRRLSAVLCAVAFSAACSEPPQKELDRAQGALDAARAAGAEQYAPESFTAATGALAEANEAVNQRDYRLALSLAVDASERAQAAAKEAADARARILGERERALAGTAAVLKELEARLADAEGAKVPSRDLKAARAIADDTAAALQEARTAIGQGDYEGARRQLEGRTEAVQEQIAAIDKLLDARAAPPARRGR